MEVEFDEKELKAAGAEPLSDGRHGLRIHGWEIESRKRSILSSSNTELWEQKLQTCHMPEMVFGDSGLFLNHVKSGATIHFNAFDALVGWKKEALPPVEVPAAAQWKFRTKPSQQVILDYDYTFTTPYSGSETIKFDADKLERGEISKETGNLHWEDCKEKIDVVALASKEPILFYDEVVLYEDELADSGVSLLTVKVLRVDGALMRLRDTRMHCSFSDDANPIILRESCWREATFQALAAKGYPSEDSAYNDPSIISQRLPVIMHKTQKLKVPGLRDVAFEK
ncbi:hypothetical protein DVH24_034321 [Malus domestica]|uniref:TIP41-like protein n=1 Tax=Malus domestica TaxID=3750 RepID=A0A498J1U6_MALDO|nr:hypothetical protein DVH24_034321 [Malus domestica]